MKYTIIDLGRDYPGKIDDFSKARNIFLQQHEWVLFVDSDEEASDMLLQYLQTLRPTYPYYAIRRINLLNGRYKPDWNPDFHPALVSNKVRFIGKLHEHVEPHRPYSIIDYPIVHNHIAADKSYSSGWKDTAAYRPIMILKKLLEISKGR